MAASRVRCLRVGPHLLLVGRQSGGGPTGIGEDIGGAAASHRAAPGLVAVTIHVRMQQLATGLGGIPGHQHGHRDDRERHQNFRHHARHIRLIAMAVRP